MLVSQILDQYIKDNPIYDLIKFSLDAKGEKEKLHPLFIITQYIIDKFIADGRKRIAIILPDNDCNILPLIIVKYFSNVQYKTDYVGSVLEDIKLGQHVRLGKAVVEFEGIDEKNKIIKFRTDKKNPLHISCPINGIHDLFEKTEGSISSYKAWNKAKKQAEEQLSKADNLIMTLKVKRTALKKTIALLSAKNDFKEFVENLQINGHDFDDIIAYGEIDLDEVNRFKLYNKGRLDCLPSVAVTTKLEDLYYLLKLKETKEKIFAIFSTIEKFDEVINNPDTFKKILKHGIPFIVFFARKRV